MDIPNVQHLRWVEMIRFFNRVQNMKDDRLPKVVLNWDFVSRTKGWLSDLSSVLTKLGLDPPEFDTPAYNLDMIQALVQGVSRLEWEEEALTKPKLRTYIKVRCLDEQPCLVKANVTCRQRSLVAKLRCEKTHQDHDRPVETQRAICAQIKDHAV